MEAIGHAQVGLVLGSASDLPVMKEAFDFLDLMGVPFEVKILSAHRTPHLLADYASKAARRGIRLIIAAAGGAAHLPGVIAAHTVLPVIGVPIKSSNSMDGWDSVLSMLQMPAGVPVATVALNGARNAAILSLQILALSDEAYAGALREFRASLEQKTLRSQEQLETLEYKNLVK